MKISTGAIITKNNKYLLQKRDNKKSIYFPGFWGVFGGTINKGETVESCMIREIKEETNLKVSIKRKIIEKKFTSREFKEIRKRVYFECKNSSNSQFILSEGSDYKYFTIDQIKNLNIIPWDLEAICYHNLIYIKKIKLLPKKK